MKHPAKYSAQILAAFAQHIAPTDKVLDPFGGTGLIHTLDANTTDVEIEPEWANMAIPEGHTGTRICGNALRLPFPDGAFDVLSTSPCYGNRFSDSHKAKDSSTRRSYTHDLRAATGNPDRKLHPDNSGTLQWGDAYRAFHVEAWTEAVRVLRPGGRFILNIKDHPRNGKRQYVSRWHHDTLVTLGLTHETIEHIEAAGMRYGANRERTKTELIYTFRRPQ